MLSVALVVATTLLANAASAEESSTLPSSTLPSSTLPSSTLPSSTLKWRARRQHPADYLAAGAFATVALLDQLLPDDEETRWSGPILFDDAAREATLLGNPDDREIAARISDVSIGLLAGYTAVDAVAVAWLGHGSADVGFQMLMIDIEAFAFTTALTGMVKRAGGRARPATTACLTDPRYVEPRCAEKTALRSFYSGHASIAFTGAALTCLHHAEHDLYGGDGDVLACVSATTVASTAALERMLADRHYASDVIVGAAAGILSGAVIPWLSFYRWSAGAENAAQGAFRAPRRWVVRPQVDDQMLGIGVFGVL